MSNQQQANHTSVGEVIRSVAAAFFGVQSSQQRERDFTHGKPWHYVFAAFGMTAAVVLVFYSAVQLVLLMAT